MSLVQSPSSRFDMGLVQSPSSRFDMGLVQSPSSRFDMGLVQFPSPSLDMGLVQSLVKVSGLWSLHLFPDMTFWEVGDSIMCPDIAALLWTSSEAIGSNTAGYKLQSWLGHSHIVSAPLPGIATSCLWAPDTNNQSVLVVVGTDQYHRADVEGSVWCRYTLR